MDEQEVRLLQMAASDIGITLSTHQIDQIGSYVDLIEKWNRAYNLTAVRGRQHLLTRHILESLAIAPFIFGDRRVDVGTGAGLPGIPLAIADPAAQYVLLDSNGKKTRFLLEVKRQLGLSNIEVETTRVETWRPANRVDAVITRAFADLATTVERIDHVLSDQGVLFAMKTENAHHELKALPWGMEQSACRDITVPNRDWSFQLLTIRRIEETAR
jgi:16S rRNA (guanine527-N7)-methyltransferase